MKKILTVAAVIALGGAGYAISAAEEKPADGASTSRPACCARKDAVKATAKAEGDGAYCQKGATAAAATAASEGQRGQKVTLTGKVLCEHCDLKMAASCSPALKAEGREVYLKISPTSKDVHEMKTAGHVQVEGYVRPGPDGKDEIEVVSFSKRPEKT